MCTINEFKIANDQQHKELRKDMKNISLVNKVLLSIIMAIFGFIFVINFSYLKTIASYSEKSYDVRVETSRKINDLSKNMWLMETRINKKIENLVDTSQLHWNNLLNIQKEDRKWTHIIYDKEIHPTYLKTFKK